MAASGTSAIDATVAGSSAPWRQALRTRLGHDKAVKCGSTIAGTALFFWAYFAVMRAPWAAPVTVPVTRWDYLVPISEHALYWYGTLWVYIPIAPALARDRADLQAYWIGAIAMSVIGLSTFWLFPTAVPDLPIDWQQYPLLAFLKTADVSGNALPSMHVAFAVFTAGAIGRHLRQIGAPVGWRVVIVGWAAIIVWSTLATRQHLIVDVAGGAMLGGAAVCLTLARYRTPSASSVSGSRSPP